MAREKTRQNKVQWGSWLDKGTVAFIRMYSEKKGIPLNESADALITAGAGVLITKQRETK